MLQRIQTLYLLTAFLLCIGCLCSPIAHFVHQGDVIDMYNLWLSNGKVHVFYFCPVLMGILVVTATLTFADIWLFRRRALQMRVATLCMILLVAWYLAYGIIVYLFQHMDAMTWRPHWTAALPAAALVLLYLAFRGILRDEMLVRSLDRLR